MGIEDVGRMSLWEYGAAVQGYNKAHSPAEEHGTLSEEEYADLSSWLDESI